ncbi:carbohydrate kinase [Cohnella silvisoli]|uniref:Winged helix-turn-helix transcriptional regulator n=1 Tax=Cohnella silvisoli TaxID=2873699 RepID=A0ABV1KMB6_9BACL|nr:carbohydrate kinase [Cohnella silvisoli]MCD9020444.1 winged helix-turn-helix transcriptional regulator [Cohnella silvisoli]
MDREQQILDLIRHNPFISQNEIASSIGISRSAVAGYIAALTKKGVIRGRAYVTAEENSVLCIGGANLDSKATSKQRIRPASSNPATVTESCGGVARNIADNLAHLACTVSLLTVVGDDQAGQWVLKESARNGVDTGLSYVLPNEKTGSYTALLDESGEMFVAFADMDIYDKFTPRLIQEKWPHIAASKLVVADTNLPAESLDELVKRCRDSMLPLFIDPVSSEKTKKLPRNLSGVTAIFPNLEEAIELAGVGAGAGAGAGASADTSNVPDFAKIAQAIRERGVLNVFITLGESGVLYSGEEGSFLLPPIPADIIEVTGAGDAFVAGVAYGFLHNQPYVEACKLGLAASYLTLQTAESVSGLLNEQTIRQTAKERLS